MAYKHCPGIKDLIRPADIVVRTCPACGEEVEFFSDEVEVKCPNCGKTLHREASASCVSWCKYADKCIEDLKNRKLISEAKAEELMEIARKTNPHLKGK
ncbi:hypothetical protein DRO53_00025 [Candidatus Bathyarchaeota archaeon]|nr:MAG: hypothetical protein DRO46_03445 [Candidatus Hecatellales archaeon]RLI35858.1 MAG: hypothetical protein DRO53_00025 [Candidatus Bathyarchaeota archaeon]